MDPTTGQCSPMHELQRVRRVLDETQRLIDRVRCQLAGIERWQRRRR